MKNVKTKVIALLTAAVLVVGIPTKQASANGDREVFGTLVGAAVGGLIGSRMGRGDGRLATTAIGTLIGAGIGNTISRNGRHTVFAPSFAPRPQPRHRVVTVHPRPRIIQARYNNHYKKRRWNKRKYWNQKRRHGRWTPPGYRGRYYGPNNRRIYR